MQGKQKNWAVISCCIGLLGGGVSGGVSAQEVLQEKSLHTQDTGFRGGIPSKGLPSPSTSNLFPSPSNAQSQSAPSVDTSRPSNTAPVPAPVPNTANGGAQGAPMSSKPAAGKSVVRNPQAAQVYKGRFGSKLSTLPPKVGTAQAGGKLAVPMLPEIIPQASNTPKADVAQAGPSAAASGEKQLSPEAKKTTGPKPNAKPAAEPVVVQKVIVDGKTLVAVDAKGSGLLMVARPEKEFEKISGTSAQAVSPAGAQTVNMPSAAVRSLGASGPSNVGRVQVQESPSSLRQSPPRPNVQFD
jgi:hypothetical protein